MLSTEMAVRLSLLSAAVWWAYFTLIPYRGIKDRAPRGVAPEEKFVAGAQLRDHMGH